MDFWYIALFLMIGGIVGWFLTMLLFSIGCPKIGTLILDLSQDEKDIAQFVFSDMDLYEISRYKTGRLEIKTSSLRSLDGR